MKGRYANNCHSGIHGYPPGHNQQMSEWAMTQARRQAYAQEANMRVMEIKGPTFSVPSATYRSHFVLCILIYECIPHSMVQRHIAVPTSWLTSVSCVALTSVAWVSYLRLAIGGLYYALVEHSSDQQGLWGLEVQICDPIFLNDPTPAVGRK